MEDEWEKTAAEINKKLKEMGKIMKEINQLREKAGVTSFTTYNLYWDDDRENDEVYDDHYVKMNIIDFSPLFDEMDAGGWSTSSMNCPT